MKENAFIFQDILIERNRQTEDYSLYIWKHILDLIPTKQGMCEVFRLGLASTRQLITQIRNKVYLVYALSFTSVYGKCIILKISISYAKITTVLKTKFRLLESNVLCFIVWLPDMVGYRL